MKSIEEAAKEWTCLDPYYNDDVQEAFKGGVAFAQRWIDVNDELPNTNKNVYVYYKFFDKFTNIRYESTSVGYVGYLREWRVKGECNVDGEITVIRWRQIELI